MQDTPERIKQLLAERARELTTSDSRELTTSENSDLPREVYNTTRESPDFSPSPREVYKEQKKERINYISRLCEESQSVEVSKETCRMAFPLESPHDIGTSSSSLGGELREGSCSLEQGVMCQEEGVSLSGGAGTSSRTISAITAQQCRTKKGIKVMLTYQLREDAESGGYIEITAELKRHDRLRELKPYADDSDQFAQVYQVLRQTIRDEEDSTWRKRFCMGRVHERGRRSEWMADVCVMGVFVADQEQVLEYVMVFYQDERYRIDLNSEMSPRQAEIFLNNGQMGNINRNKQAPTLFSLKRKY